MTAVSASSQDGFEKIFYFALWIFGVFYAIFRFTKDNSEFFQDYNDVYGDFEEGWIKTQKKDVSDLEWESLLIYFKTVYLWIIFLLLISELLRKFKLNQIIAWWQIVLAVSFLAKEFGVFAVASFLVQPLLFTVLFSLWKTKTAIWICAVGVHIILWYFDLFAGSKKFAYYIEHLPPSHKLLMMTGISWTNLKCTSYHLEYLNDDKMEYKFKNLLSYCLYLPTIISGPFVSYQDHSKCVKEQTGFYRRIFRLILDLSRFLFWMIFTEIMLHFVYVNATGFQTQWVQTLNSWSLYGYGYAMGQFFHMKYVVSYGLSTSIAKYEGVRVPPPPKCIGRIHLYSDMWKYFDVGFYNFLLRHIYIPSVTSEVIQSPLFSSLLCFMFVFIWHGVQMHILIWTCLNYFGIIVEKCSAKIWERYRSKAIQNLGETWTVRLCCLIASPLMAMSALSNFYFFAGTTIANIFVYRIFNDTLLATAVLIVLLYGCCQISTELRKRRI